MSETSNIFLEILDSKEPEFLGIAFLLNFLKDTTYEKMINGQRVSFPIMNPFRRNVVNVDKMLSSRPYWERMSKTGDVQKAIVSAFDWDKSPEGYEYWNDINDKFNESLKKALDKGMNMNCRIPKIHEEAQTTAIDRHPQASTMKIMPSEITLKLLRYISPLCEHPTNKQIDILVDVLKTFKCADEFYTNLRIKPKHKDYERQFEEFLKGNDLRSIIYWAFNWASTEQGFSFWSKISDKVNATITQELTMGRYNPNYINPNTDYTPGGAPIMHVEPTKDPITHTTEVMKEGAKPSHTEYRPPIGYTTTRPYPSQCSPSYPMGPIRTFYDDYVDEEECDYWDAYAMSYYAPKKVIPNDILNMPVTTSVINVEVKEETVSV